LVLAGAAILAACAPREPAPGPSAIEVAAPTPPLAAPPSPIPPLRADTGGFADRTDLLDGVCYEFLAALAGQVWVWRAQADLDAFSARVAESELCADAPSLTFDFDRSALAGAVSAGTGCDAAHHVLGLARDDAARTVTLRLAWEIRPGCDYELLEPILLEVPAPPPGYTLRVAVSGAG